jgi:tRNA threonylcarbamoyladenosine biosynthesis protein TsaE
LLISVFSEEKMMELGKILGEMASSGDIFCLTGDLGAGKTTITKSIAKSLEVEDYITSPTFTIVNEYAGRIPLYHFDVYRIDEEEEMYEIGSDEYFYGEGLCVIEWANLITNLIPENALWMDIRIGDEFTTRIIEVTGNHALVDELKEKLIGKFEVE